MELRPYQEESVVSLRGQFRDGAKRVLLVSPTGSGKTVLFVYVTKGSAAKGLRTLILTHRSEILGQISRTLHAWDVPHALLTAGRHIPEGYRVMVASVSTLVRRLEGSPAPDFVVVDECHHSAATTWLKVFAAYPNAKWLGVTATPERLDGKGLGQFYERMVMGPGVQWLIDNGFLARPRYFAHPNAVDVSKLRQRGGDFAADELEELIDKSTILGDAVEHYQQHAPGRTCIVFCISIKHAQRTAEAFRAAGITAEVIEGRMGETERQAILGRFRDRRTMVLVAVDLVSEGFDLPAVGAASLLRPTASLALHLQQIGRSLRPAPGKEDSVILDHAGNCLRHGLAEEDRAWSLEGHSAKKRQGAIPTQQCPKCYAIFRLPPCPECGWAPEPNGEEKREIVVANGSLVELNKDTFLSMATIRNRKQEERMCRTLEDFQRLAKLRGYKPGWAYFRWKASWKSKATQKPKMAEFAMQ